jgi:glycosyltransferase involved in cell wall biosynthesis
MKTAIVHDYLTQRGGAERVVLAMSRAFPDAPIFTSLYEPETTFPAFAERTIRTTRLNDVALLRSRHRLAMPLLAGAFSHFRVDADVVICSSSGWAHGAAVTGRKVVYCHAPARWLYQTDRYLQGRGAKLAFSLLRARLRRWDEQASRSADRYVVNSTYTQALVRDVYGREADVLHPPYAIDPVAPQHAPDGLSGGFVLCVSRLLRYKNVDAVLGAFERLPGEQVVVVGTGPDEQRLRALAPSNAVLLGRVDDDELRWLYANCAGLVAASYEDFGLTPLEAAAFGKPAAVLAFGGFLDTVEPGETGVFFDQPDPGEIAAAVRHLLDARWSQQAILDHANLFSEERFAERLQAIAVEEAGVQAARRPIAARWPEVVSA